MKVLCINDAWILHNHNVCETPVFMQEYEVIGHRDIPLDHGQYGVPLMEGRYYKLAGLNPDRGFHQSNFAILPDTTADEMAEQTHEAIINIETPII